MTHRTRLATLLLVAGLAGTSAAQTPTWKAELLGTPPPSWGGVWAVAVNDAGLVTGNTYLSGYKHAWIAGPDQPLELLPLPSGANWSEAYDMNAAGVVGGSVLIGGAPYGVVWFPGPSGYEVFQLPSGPGGWTPYDARGINDAGDVVGKYGVLGGSYVWNETSGITQLTTATFPVVPDDINDQRQIIGDTYRMDLDTLVLEDLGNPTGTTYNYIYTELTKINNAGECVGYAVTATSGWPYLPVRFTDGPVWKVFSNFPLNAAGALDISASGDTVFQLGIYGTYVYVDGFGSIPLQGLLAPAYAEWDVSSSFAPAISRGNSLALTGANSTTGEAGVLLLTPLDFVDMGGGATGALGNPVLTGYGTVEPGEPVRVRLSNGAPGSVAVLSWATPSGPQPLTGGVLRANVRNWMVARPDISLVLPTDALGRCDITFPWPSSPPGTTVVLQAMILDPAVPSGMSMSNALMAVTR